MELSNNKPKLLVKAKNLQLVFDYCIENKLRFGATPRLGQDEWEFELNISDIMAAVALGVFAKEHKLEILGLNYVAPTKNVAPVVAAQPAKAAKTAKVTAKKPDFMEDTTTELEVESSGLLSSEADLGDENAIINNTSELAF